MKDAENENEPFPFQSLAQITARLLQGEKTKNEERPADRASERNDEQREEQQRHYVEQRLRDLAAFEARARGAWKRQ
ncbi:hypothetical protein [Bradyrhizobium retamae]|uniref:hypothetical protein n=1 Tax=Bradyrhizobium retamae TaxID=1300035 RepID=UPI0012E3A028|nr:hypothetical protein [Bradyrhizobium retamae]